VRDGGFVEAPVAQSELTA